LAKNSSWRRHHTQWDQLKEIILPEALKGKKADTFDFKGSIRRRFEAALEIMEPSSSRKGRKQYTPYEAIHQQSIETILKKIEAVKLMPSWHRRSTIFPSLRNIKKIINLSFPVS